MSLKYEPASEPPLNRGERSTCIARPHGLGFRVLISVKVLITCCWRNEIYYTHALLLLVWFICVVIFVAQKQLIDSSMEIRLYWTCSSVQRVPRMLTETGSVFVRKVSEPGRISTSASSNSCFLCFVLSTLFECRMNRFVPRKTRGLTGQRQESRKSAILQVHKSTFT
jgi:hypothetical protein